MAVAMISPEVRKVFSEFGKQGGRPRCLTQQQADDVRRRVGIGESRVDLAKEYGIAKSTIDRIVRRERY